MWVSEGEVVFEKAERVSLMMCCGVSIWRRSPRILIAEGAFGRALMVVRSSSTADSLLRDV